MRAYRSPWKLFVIGVVGIVLIAAAVDLGFGHWVSTPPDKIDGVLTTRGHAEHRGDIVWGGAMVAAGALLFGRSIAELLRRRPVIVVTGDGIQIGPGSDDASGFIPWSSIEMVSSGIAPDLFEGSDRERLVIEVKAGTLGGADLVDVTREQDIMYVDAHDWTKSVTDMALAAQGALDHFLRMEAIRTYELPSVVWEVTMDQLPPTEGSGEERVPDDERDEDTREDDT